MHKEFLFVGGMLVLFGMIILFYNAPWLTLANQKSLIDDKLLPTTIHVQDGPSIDCDECGLINSKKVPFGREVTYRINSGGLLPEDAPISYNEISFFISFICTVHSQ